MTKIELDRINKLYNMIEILRERIEELKIYKSHIDRHPNKINFKMYCCDDAGDVTRLMCDDHAISKEVINLVLKETETKKLKLMTEFENL